MLVMLECPIFVAIVSCKNGNLTRTSQLFFILFFIINTSQLDEENVMQFFLIFNLQGNAPLKLIYLIKF